LCKADFSYISSKKMDLSKRRTSVQIIAKKQSLLIHKILDLIPFVLLVKILDLIPLVQIKPFGIPKEKAK
jgi:hypothetical protein